jgi:hypothetical protein
MGFLMLPGSVNLEPWGSKLPDPMSVGPCVFPVGTGLYRQEKPREIGESANKLFETNLSYEANFF